MYVKNVPTLIVKVFEINTLNFYRASSGRSTPTSTSTAWWPTRSRRYKYDEPPLRRVRRTFEFPQLNKPGVYVIDFIGGGKSSRALVRKGRLRPLVSAPAPPGQVVTVVDEKNQPVNDATSGSAGRSTRADKDGAIAVPFTAQPGRRPVVLSRGDFSRLDAFDHQPESYALAAGIHVDRESLLRRREARPAGPAGALLERTPVSLKLLEDVELRHQVDRPRRHRAVDGGAGLQAVRGPRVGHEFRSRRGWRRSPSRCTAKVKNLSPGQDDRPRRERSVRAQRDRHDRQDRGPAPARVRRRTT